MSLLEEYHMWSEILGERLCTSLMASLLHMSHWISNYYPIRKPFQTRRNLGATLWTHVLIPTAVGWGLSTGWVPEKANRNNPMGMDWHCVRAHHSRKTLLPGMMNLWPFMPPEADGNLSPASWGVGHLHFIPFKGACAGQIPMLCPLVLKVLGPQQIDNSSQIWPLCIQYSVFKEVT